MGNSIKKWHKSVLLCSIVVGLVCGTALAQPDDYIYRPFPGIPGMNWPMLGYNSFSTGAGDPWDRVAVTFWLGGEITGTTGFSTVSIYDEVPFSSATALKQASIATTAGEHTVTFDMDSTMGAGTYYAMLQPGNSTHAVYTSGTQNNLSFFSFDNGSTWSDLNTYTFDSGNAIYSWPSAAEFNAPGNFTISAVPSMAPVAGINATGVEGDWVITNQQFNEQTDTFTLDKTANELEPFVAELEVTGGMSPIFITETVTNETGEDWIGYGFQLGFWDDVDERFVSSTFGDSLAFRQGFNSSGEFGSPTVSGEDGLYFDGALIPAGGTATFNLMVDLPGDPVFTFALRQYAIPEPGTAMLLGIVGLMLLGFRRRR